MSNLCRLCVWARMRACGWVRVPVCVCVHVCACGLCLEPRQIQCMCARKLEFSSKKSPGDGVCGGGLYRCRHVPRLRFLPERPAGSP